MATFTATTSPMLITSAATVTFAVPRPCNAKRIEWVGATTLGHVCAIADIDSTPNVIFSETAGQTLTGITMWPGPGKFMLPGKQPSFAGSGNAGGSFQVTTIQSGTL